MAERKVVLQLAGCLVVFALVFVLGLQNGVSSINGAPAAEESTTVRSDLIMIDGIAEQVSLELPAVNFMHDRHTKVLQEQGKDCFTCHKKDAQGKMSLSFMRLEDPPADELKELYHQGCAGCHAENSEAGLEKAGPQVGECRKCHVQSSSYLQEHIQAGMNNALHYRHWISKEIPADKGEKTNCGSCHHEYDSTAEKLTYIKFQEEGCTACHTDSPEGDVKTSRTDAFHQQCVGCHLALKDAEVADVGPIFCAGCHSKGKALEIAADNKALINKLGGVLPRLPRRQPDASLLVLPAEQEGSLIDRQDGIQSSAMPVAFNHKIHEERTDSCADCHHMGMKPCVECHSLSGKAEGGFVPLEEAMHMESSSRSCAGCHAKQQKEPVCAGCHTSMANGLFPPASSCNDCHLSDPRAFPRRADGSLLIPEYKETRSELAAFLITERSARPVLLPSEDIPEVVKIDSLANEYEPSEMPHRKIVLKMFENMENNSLAAVSHPTPLSMCQGCHHNSPASAQPPQCQSCHGKPFQEQRLGRPGLKAAYHAQCMDCHDEMGLEKPAATDCTACHRKKEING